jgi:hypothetical protein
MGVPSYRFEFTRRGVGAWRSPLWSHERIPISLIEERVQSV